MWKAFLIKVFTEIFTILLVTEVSLKNKKETQQQKFARLKWQTFMCFAHQNIK